MSGGVGGLLWSPVLRQIGRVGWLPRLLLQLLWAAARGLYGSPAIMWSAVHGSRLPLSPSPQRWQKVAVARMALDRFL